MIFRCASVDFAEVLILFVEVDLFALAGNLVQLYRLQAPVANSFNR